MTFPQLTWMPLILLVFTVVFLTFFEEDSHYIIPVVPEPSVVTVGSRVVLISPGPEVVVL